MDNSWKTVQTKTFTKWINAKLSTSIVDIYSSLRDGIVLSQLLVTLTGDDLPVPLTFPATTRFQKVENVQYVLDFISARGIPLVNIGSVDIVDGNEKLILGLVWIIILRFSIFRSPMEAGVDNTLLNWCKAATAPYGIVVKDFSRSWQDGKAFNAVLARFIPDAVDPAFMRIDDPAKCLEAAFAVAEERLDIPRLLDAEDIAGVLRPDEKSVMTYLSLYYEKLKHLSPSCDNSRVSELQAALDLRKKAALTARDAHDSLDSIRICMRANREKYDSLMQEAAALYSANMELERALASGKREIAVTVGTIRTIENTLGIPPSDLSIFHASAVQKERNRIKYCEKCFSVLKANEDTKIIGLSESQQVDNQLISDSCRVADGKSFPIQAHEPSKIDTALFEQELRVLSDSDDLNKQLLLLEKEISESSDDEFKELAAQKLKILRRVLIHESHKNTIEDALKMYESIAQNDQIKLSEAEIIFQILNLQGINQKIDEPVDSDCLKRDAFIEIVQKRLKNSYNISYILDEINALKNFDLASSSSTTDETTLRNMRENYLLKMEELFRSYDIFQLE